MTVVRARGVGVVDAQHEVAAGVAREQAVEQAPCAPSRCAACPWGSERSVLSPSTQGLWLLPRTSSIPLQIGFSLSSARAPVRARPHRERPRSRWRGRPCEPGMLRPGRPAVGSAARLTAGRRACPTTSTRPRTSTPRCATAARATRRSTPPGTSSARALPTGSASFSETSLPAASTSPWPAASRTRASPPTSSASRRTTPPRPGGRTAAGSWSTAPRAASTRWSSRSAAPATR